MINLLIGAIPGLVAALAVWLLAVGLRGWRYNPVDAIDPAELIDASVLRSTSPGTKRNVFARLGTRFVPLVRRALPATALRRLQRQIDLAGRPDGVTVDGVLAQQAGLLLAALPLALIYAQAGFGALIFGVVALAVLWPLIRLTTLARKRREQIDRDLPDFLDVLAVTVSAGIGFRSAIATVAERFGGPLGEEITTSLHQIANGATVRSAFKNLRDRSGSEAMEEFVTAYLQAEELGAPLVEALNQIAADMRRADAQRALQRANGVTPRITLVTTIVMVPATLILIVAGLILGSGVDFGALFGG
ncbi:MAG: type II secretion system F family protein [Propioniciclava sp.]|uniref:type II secretion system F family protein n=1 Tax=Propioniciclava sp. TaxID=2038686 RepID=UPI0039E558AB